MNKTTRHYTQFLCSVFALSILIAGCAKPFLVKPADGYTGNILIKSVEVTKTDAVQSDTIVAAVKSKIEQDAADLRGDKSVTMKVELNYLTVPLPGGGVTQKLLGSNTTLRGVVSIVDNGEVVAKYEVNAEYSEGGLLSKSQTISFVDLEEAVVRTFSAHAISYMQ